MKVSFFENLIYSTGVDYSKHKNCICVLDLSDDILKKLELYYFTIENIDKNKKGELIFLDLKDEFKIKNEQYKKEIEKANIEFQERVQMLMVDYTQEEIASFEIKRQEAEKVLAGGTSEFLEGLLIEGETIEDLVDKIMINSKNYQIAYAIFEKELREKTKEIKIKYGI